jgi:hypothetical protein
MSEINKMRFKEFPAIFLDEKNTDFTKKKLRL